jgi:hypothetical protein
MRRDQLELHSIVSYHGFQLCRAFIVEDVQLGEDARRIHMVNESLICPDHLTGRSVLHRLNENRGTVYIGQNHDVLISAT